MLKDHGELGLGIRQQILVRMEAQMEDLDTMRVEVISLKQRLRTISERTGGLTVPSYNIATERELWKIEEEA